MTVLFRPADRVGGALMRGKCTVPVITLVCASDTPYSIDWRIENVCHECSMLSIFCTVARVWHCILMRNLCDVIVAVWKVQTDPKSDQPEVTVTASMCARAPGP